MLYAFLYVCLYVYNIWTEYICNNTLQGILFLRSSSSSSSSSSCCCCCCSSSSSSSGSSSSRSVVHFKSSFWFCWHRKWPQPMMQFVKCGSRFTQGAPFTTLNSKSMEIKLWWKLIFKRFVSYAYHVVTYKSRIIWWPFIQPWIACFLSICHCA